MAQTADAGPGEGGLPGISHVCCVLGAGTEKHGRSDLGMQLRGKNGFLMYKDSMFHLQFQS